MTADAKRPIAIIETFWLQGMGGGIKGQYERHSSSRVAAAKGDRKQIRAVAALSRSRRRPAGAEKAAAAFGR